MAMTAAAAAAIRSQQQLLQISPLGSMLPLPLSSAFCCVGSEDKL